MIIRKSQAEVARIAAAGRVLADCIDLLADAVRPGVTTEELDRIAEAFIRERGGVPTFLGYRGFPRSICASPNDMVVHGIPGKHRVADGDVLSLDVGVTMDGFVADSAISVPVGAVDAEARRLMDVTRESLEAGLAECRIGRRLGDVSHAVQEVVEAAGFSVVRSLVGHGVGRTMHEDPQIPNYGEPGRGPRLAEGMVFAIEPMVNAGGHEVYVADDGWGIYTSDGSLSAHFEHTVAVTRNGPKVLTRRRSEKM
ncbi:MAG TPA: type I methionyl aminopeptidase [Thermoleophilia bacterium]|nr:type I methionyl aminopeptidase [Thermoleophilia bacterium]HQG02877.1 type I methionyl aminopeptidase [Thermoleophilia bacterium]HQJ97905.1 type I methionyl aminopeptidase [Thermoleophilia bacterium]